MFSTNYILCKLKINKNSMDNEVLKSRNNNVRFLKILSLEGKLLEILLLLRYEHKKKQGRKHTVF